MSTSKNYSTLKTLESLNYLIASEFSRHREELHKQSRHRTNEFVWPIFSLLGVYCVNQVIKNPSEMPPLQAVLLILVYLITYFIIVKKIMIPFFQKVSKWWDNSRGVSIDTNQESQKTFVTLFNGTLCNQVLLAYSFLQQAFDEDLKNEELKKYYIAESIYCLQNPITEIDTIESRKDLKSKIIFDGTGHAITSIHIKLYRYNSVISIIKQIISAFNDNLQSDPQHNSLLRDHIQNLNYTVSKWKL